MSEPFLGEIRMFGFNFPPRDWAYCNGALLPIHENPALYSLLGTTFGGDGKTSFGLPDMRGRVPVHKGTGFVIGQRGGAEEVTLNTEQLPAHSHAVMGTTEKGDSIAARSTRSFATSSDANDPIYGAPRNLVAMNDDVLTQAEDGGQSHNNVQPINVINFCIALEGLYPSRN